MSNNKNRVQLPKPIIRQGVATNEREEAPQDKSSSLLRNAYSYLQTAAFHESGTGTCTKCGKETFYRERTLCLDCLKAECERELGLGE